MQDTVVLENGAAYIKGQRFPLDTHELIEVAGKGANGVVFKAKHRFLNRVEAVKLWLPRVGDKRDKIKQGIYETQNQAAAIHSQVIKILHADIINGIYYATMDYFDGGSLRNWIKDADSTFKWTAAHAYLELMSDTSSPSYGTGAYEKSEHVKRIIARGRAENLARESASMEGTNETAPQPRSSRSV